MVGGEPVQKVKKDVEFKLDYVEAAEEKIDDIIEDFIKPFDLSKAPLLRVKAVKVAGDKHFLLVDMHHIISDGVSMEILIKEFVALYNGETLPELRIQYKDFSAWQSALFATDELKKQEEYWLSHLSGEIPVLNMPADFPRPAVQSFKGSSIEFSVDEQLTTKLRGLGKDLELTLYMLLLGALNILLWKYTRQEDIIIGSAVAGRPHADLE